MAERVLEKLQQHKPTSSQVIGAATLLVAGGLVLATGGAALAVILLLSPLLLVLSPVLVPGGAVLLACVAGALAAGGAGLAAVWVVTWTYKYLKGRHPPGSHQLDYVRHRALDLASTLQCKAQQAAPGA